MRGGALWEAGEGECDKERQDEKSERTGVSGRKDATEALDGAAARRAELVARSAACVRPVVKDGGRCSFREGGAATFAEAQATCGRIAIESARRSHQSVSARHARQGHRTTVRSSTVHTTQKRDLPSLHFSRSSSIHCATSPPFAWACAA